MSNADIDEEPTEGTITFVQSLRPPLEDGLYEITVEQSVSNSNPDAPAGAVFDETYTHTRRFQVAGERFSIGSSEIDSSFPPQGSQGEYADVLPHVVFVRRTLPWERTVGDAARSTWLALLVFDESDPPPKVTEALVGDLQPAPFPHGENGPDEPSSLPPTAVSYPDLELEYGEVPWDPCRVIDVPVALLDQILPGADDMPWLAHSRALSHPSPLRMAGLRDGQTSVDSSVVVANRLPTPNSLITVHLVSLENMIAHLPLGEGYAAAGISLADGQPAELVRLVSLHSWSYRSVDPEDTFTGLLMKLDEDDGLRVLAIANASTGTSDADAYVANALKLGYTPVNHHTRQGSRTVSWYRGPLLPMGAEMPGAMPPVKSADEAVQYDPGTGMMDVTYAAAWQIGRLLALQDKGFAEALTRWKRANTRRAFEAFERDVLERALGGALALTHTAVARSDGNDMHHAVAHLVRTRLKPHLIQGEEPE